MPASTSTDEATHAVTHTTSPGPRITKLRRAIALQGLGGLVVAVTFFLPAVKGCSSPVVPALEILEAIDHGDSLDDWAFAMWILLPYLFGLSLVISSLRRRQPERVHATPRDYVTPILLGVWIAVYGAMLLSDFDQWGLLWFWRQPGVIVCGGGALIACFYVACGTRRREAWSLSVRGCALLLMLFWFGIWIVGNFNATYYGIWLSTAGTIAMLVGVVWEAAIRSILPWRAALWGLVRCRLELRGLDQPYCQRCGYWLIGLTSRRCPECGTPFESEEAYLDPNRAR